MSKILRLGNQPLTPDSGMFGFGLLVVTALYLTISTLTLLKLGFNYEESGGNVFEKIHPATLIAAVILAAALLARGNPLRSLHDIVNQNPRTAIFVAMIGLMIGYSIEIVRLPFTGFIDTFIAPVIVFYLFKGISETRARYLVWLIHALLLLNAIIGIGEFITGDRLTPLIANGVVISDDWRSTALLGHPLANASLTGAYLLAMAVGGSDDLPKPVAALCFIVNSAAMVVFGGRASTVILLALLACLALLSAIRILRGARFDKTTVLIGLLLVPIVSLVVLTLTEAGFFAQFLERFVDDKGSASTRIAMFELFHYLSWYQLLFVPDADQLTTLKRIFGLDFGIESFWVSFVLDYGLIPSLAFFAALFLFCWDLLRAARPGTIWVLIFFFLVASTSVSLSAKSTIFAVLVLFIMTLLRLPQAEPVSRVTRRGHYVALAELHGRPA
jgi:hypothetical protein